MSQQSFHQQTATGADINFTIDTFESDEIKVYVDGDLKTAGNDYNINPYNTNSQSTVDWIGTAPSSPSIVRIVRETDVLNAGNTAVEGRATYTAGSSVKAEDLNNNTKQVLRALQEHNDQLIQTYDVQDSAITTAKIKADNITSALIADDQIDSEHIVADSIDTEHYAPNSVDTTALAADAVTGAQIGDSQINSEHYADGSIDREHLAGDIIDSTKLADNAVNSEHYVDGSIDRVHLAADIVDGTKIADNSIDSEHYVDGSIDTVHIGNVQVTTGKIANDAVTSDKIASDTIATGNIANNAITRGKILDGEVVRSKIEADAIDGTKLADNAVNSEHYTDGSIDRVHLSADIIDSTKLADNAVNSEHYVDGSIDNVHIANSTITSQKIVDATLDTATLADDAVTEPKIINGAVTTNKIAADAVNGTKIADDSIDSEHYVDGSIDNQHIANSTITSAKIVDETLDTATLANSAVTEPKIATGAVTTTKIADDAVTAAKIADAVIVTNSEQASHSVNDTTFFTTAAAEARYFNASTGETIKDGQTFPDNDTTIATTAAINDRIIDLVDDVGGFVPIANETSFPTSNPDVNNGTGTIVSVSAASTNLVPSGTTVTIANGRGSGLAVIITGVSATIPSGFGFLVETTTTAHTYTFHRLVPVATQVETVANNITNVVNAGSNTTNINTVAGQISPTNNVSTVAGIATAVSTVATNNSNVTSVANNMANVNNFNDRYQIASNNPSTDGGGNALAAGDLYFNTSANELKVYNGSSWQGGVTATGTFASTTGNTFTGDNRYNDGVQALFGTGSDLRIYHHTDNNSYIQNYTGDLYIKSNGDDLILQAADDILIRPQNGEDGIRLTGNGSVDLYYDASKKLETASDGTLTYGAIKTNAATSTAGSADQATFDYNSGNLRLLSWKGTGASSVSIFTKPSGGSFTEWFRVEGDGGIKLPVDNQKLYFGTGHDLSIYHDGTQSTINNTTGTLRYLASTHYFANPAVSEVMASFVQNGNCELRFDNAIKLNTAFDGVVFTGAARFVGNETGFLTSKAHPTLYRTASTSGSYPFDNFGNLVIQSRNDGSNRDIIFATGTNSAKLNRITSDGHLDIFGDNQKIRIGASDPSEIYNDGNDLFINHIDAGYLHIQGNYGVLLQRHNGTENLLKALSNGAVELMYDNNKKLETTSTGVAVTGFTDSRRDSTSTYSSTSAPPNTVARFYNQSATNDSSASVQLRARNVNHADDLWYMSVVAQSQNYNGLLSFSTRTGSSTYQETLRLLNNGYVDIPQDNAYLRIGASQDLKIFHDATNSVIQNSTGTLFLASDSTSLTNAAVSETYFRGLANGASELYYDDSKKFETKSNGVTVTGEAAITSDLVMNTADNQVIYLGAGNDLMMYHSGTHSYLKNKTGNFYLMTTNTEYGAEFHGDGAVKLNYDNSTKLETTSTGVSITGALSVPSGITGGSSTFSNIRIGSWPQVTAYKGLFHTDHTSNEFIIMSPGDGSTFIGAGSGGDVRIQVGGTGEDSAKFINNGGVELYYNNIKKFETQGGGAKVSGVLTCTDIDILHTSAPAVRLSGTTDDSDAGLRGFLGLATAANNFCNGSAAGDVVAVSPERFIIAHNATEVMAVFNDDGAVDLRYDGSTKLATKSNGVDVTGNLTSTSLTVSGATSPVSISHTGGNALELTRSGKTIAFNANYGAANTHSTINVTSGMELRLQVAGSDRVKLDSSGNWLPTTNNARDLGSTSLRWANVYTNDLHLSNKGSSNEMDGTWGDWTMQEGESDLFLKNNRSGKKYKFNLTEVA